MLQGARLGYRRDLADDFLNLSSNNAIQFMEVAPENWVKMGGLLVINLIKPLKDIHLQYTDYHFH